MIIWGQVVGTKVDLSEFETSVVFTDSSRTTKAIQRNPVSDNQKKKSNHHQIVCLPWKNNQTVLGTLPHIHKFPYVHPEVSNHHSATLEAEQVTVSELPTGNKSMVPVTAMFSLTCQELQMLKLQVYACRTFHVAFEQS